MTLAGGRAWPHGPAPHGLWMDNLFVLHLSSGTPNILPVVFTRTVFGEFQLPDDSTALIVRRWAVPHGAVTVTVTISGLMLCPFFWMASSIPAGLGSGC